MGHLRSNPSDRKPSQKWAKSSTRALQTVASRRFTCVNPCLKHTIRVAVIISTAVWLAYAPSVAAAQGASSSETDEPLFLTGKKLDIHLKKPVSVSWTEAPLARRMRAFATANQLAIFIDRRIDPDLKVNIQRANVTIEHLLLDVASELSVGMCQLDDLIYIGPTATAHALPIMWHDVPRVSSKPANRLQWDMLSRPRELLESIAEEGEIKIEDVDQIAHDLWEPGSLPPLTSSQQAAIIAVGFGQWPSATQTDSRVLKLSGFKPPSRGKIEFIRAPRDVGGSGILKATLKQKFPDVKAQVSRERVRMSGSPDKLYAAKSFLIRRNQIQTPDAKNIRFTLKTSATRLQILNAIARQTGRELIYDQSHRDTLDQQVEVECRRANLNELVDLILAGSDLQSEVGSSKIQVLSE